MQSCRKVVIALFLAAGCSNGAGGPSGGNGAPCGANEECGGGVCLALPDGYCSQDCSVEACPDGEVCTVVDGVSGCVRACAGAHECRPGYQCFQGTCRAACAADGDCGKGFACASGQCEPLPGKGIGEKCRANDECSSRLCDVKTKSCRQGCAFEQQCAAAETCYVNPVDKDNDKNTDAVSPICIPRRGGGKAVGEACKADADCHQGQCELGTCVTLCQGAGNCPANMGCVQMLHLTDVATPKINACLFKNGTVSFDIPEGGTELVPLPSNGQSFSLFVAADNMDTAYYTGVLSLEDPAGAAIYTYPKSQAELFALPIRYYQSEGTSMMLVTNNPARVKATPGLYSFRAFAQSMGGRASPYTTRVRIKLGDAPAATASVALHVFVTNLNGGCTTFNAATAKTKLAAVETYLKNIFAKAKITLTEIKYFDSQAPSSFQETPGQSNDQLMNVLQTATAGDKPDVLELVIVKRITTGGGGGFEVLGVAGGIPASVGVPGTPHSGVTASLSPLCWDKSGTQMGITIAHELGHSLGLFHNIEQDGSTDPLTDNDSDRDTNLMFWAENNRGNQNKVSAQQAQVMRNNPALRP